MDANLHLAPSELLDVDRVIKFLSSIRVDGESGFLTEISSRGKSFFTLIADRPLLKTDILDNSIREIIGTKVIIPQQGISFNFEITHFTQKLHQRTKGMKGSDWPSFNACNKNTICVVLMPFNKIARSLLSRNGNERYTLISRLEPYNLGLVLLTVLLVSTRAAFSLLTFGFLFLFCGLTARS